LLLYSLYQIYTASKTFGMNGKTDAQKRQRKHPRPGAVDFVGDLGVLGYSVCLCAAAMSAAKFYDAR
jgi:hypothetical protein